MSAFYCVNCRFWCELTADEDTGLGRYVVSGTSTGLCRRYPPAGIRRDARMIADTADVATAAAWAITWAHDWCGEFVPCPKGE
jgi:hypothetical protein